MTERRMKCALAALPWSLGLVVLIEAVFFVMPNARYDFARSHIPDVLRLVLGWGEIIGCVLFLIPRTVVRGGWILVSVFVFAIVIHLQHGMYNVGNLVIYIAAAGVVVVGKGN
jgi:uncharacterized membrane protein YphA (DoxX/SURF4 family)